MSGIAPDPVVCGAGRLFLALLFLHAGLHKLRDRRRFRAALADYRLLPAAATGPLATGLASAELALAVALCLPVGGAAAVVAAALLCVYSAAMGINLLRGRREIDCGCAGPTRRPLGAGLLLRNAGLIGVALVCAVPTSGRPLLWLDALTLAAAVAVATLLYAALEGAIREASWSTR